MVLRIALLCLIYLCLYSSIFAQIVYVQSGADGDGSSWQNANGDLRTALTGISAGTQVWVGQGTYLPTSCDNCSVADRHLRFEIPNGVAIYGGFSGTETSLDDRDWTNHPTILSGDINADQQSDSNAYTVVYFENVSRNTILDGFTVVGGNAVDTLSEAESPGKSGGGIFNFGTINSHPQIRNCHFENNYAINYGGAIYNNARNGGNTHPDIVHCTFENNIAIKSGGAIFNDAGSDNGQASPLIEHCDFRENISHYGAAIYNNGFNGVTSPRIIDCRFFENYASGIAGACYNFAKGEGLAEPVFINCIFARNFGKSAGAVYSLSNNGGTVRPVILNSTFFNNMANTGGAVYCNESSGGNTEVFIYNCIFWNSTAVFNRIFHMSGDGTPIMNVYNSLMDATGCQTVAQLDPTDSLNCGINNIYNLDPLFIDAEQYDFRALTNSPIIDAGNNEVTQSYEAFFDFAGLLRIYNEQVDLGAFEMNSEPYNPTVITNQPNSQTICEGGESTLLIDTQGTAPLSYLWYKDGMALPGEMQNHLTITNVSSEDLGSYSCQVITAIWDTIFSNPAVLALVEQQTPGLTITASATQICSGESVNFFIAEQNNQGAEPIYQWRKNGTVVGNNQSSYGTSSLSEGDVIDCILTSSLTCLTNEITFSNDITIEVTPTPDPQVIISADEQAICAGEALTFFAALQDAGTTPVIQWQLNGLNIGQNQLTLTLNLLSAEDVITAHITSSLVCANAGAVTSNELSVEVQSPLPLTVEVSSDVDFICIGEPVTFTATTQNAGPNPTYQWKVNGVGVINNSAVFTISDLDVDASITCTIISSADCLESNIVTSTPLNFEVDTILNPSISITDAPEVICLGSFVSFQAIITSAGNNPLLQWLVNGTPAASNNSIFTTNTLQDGDVVVARLMINERCTQNSIVNSNEELISFSNCTVANENILIDPPSIILSPNPVMDKASLTIEHFQGSVTLQITDFQGQIIHIEKLSINSDLYRHSLNFSSFNSGIYLLMLKGQHRLSTLKVLVP